MTGLAETGDWLKDIGNDGVASVDGLVHVEGYVSDGRPAEEVVMMEKAAAYGAHAVFFEAGTQGKAPLPQAFVFLSNGPADDPAFAALHRRLWSWGGVPLAYRRTPGLVQLFRCAHRPDFVTATGRLVCKPVKVLKLSAAISAEDAWWNAERLRNGTVWDDPEACKLLLSATKSAHRRLVDAVATRHKELKASGLLNASLRRRLLILSLLIAYLEERGALPPDYFLRFRPGATRFFEVLAHGPALVELLTALENRFNGNVFSLSEADRQILAASTELQSVARLIEAREDSSGQLSLWALYSFRDLPVEVISHIYQLFVTDSDSSVYTPPSLVRLLLEEAMDERRMDRLFAQGELVLDPACGSGVFLVEAYKRLVRHWRSRNGWVKPGVAVLKRLLDHLRGVDVERGAIELAAFSLCLALCDALEPEDIRASVQLFPKLADRSLIQACFFEAKDAGRLTGAVGVLLGNPPFESVLRTDGAKRSCARYVEAHGTLPDNQVAYLFLHESMDLIAPGGMLCMLQQYNLLYNTGAARVRQTLFERWDVREILDFVSIRGLFQKGGADTKIIALLAEASPPPADRRILHAVFRRGGRAEAEQGFNIDYYDLHWLPREHVLEHEGPEVWRSNLLGGARTFHFLRRLRALGTLKDHAADKGWHVREGFVEGDAGVSRKADHIIGRPLLPSSALTLDGIDRSKIVIAPDRPIEGPRTAELFTPPMLLVREHMDLPHEVWTDGYLTFKNQIVAFAQAPTTELLAVDAWLRTNAMALRAYVAGISGKLFTQKATTLAGADILALPFLQSGGLDLSANEQIVAQDIVQHYRGFVRRGSESAVARLDAGETLPAFADLFSAQINAIYRQTPIRPLTAQRWPGVLCQPFVFGETGSVDWQGADELRGKLEGLLREQKGSSLAITRIARIYDGRHIFLLKPDRLRYWLRSIALRDSDDVLADLRAQGF